MEKVKISIIVPIYNAEKYIKECVYSILNQTFKDFELILVNDGSKDSSLYICENLAKTDSRIKVITQENCGSSSAKNLGIKNASAKYISFVDADDYIDKKYVENLFYGAEKFNADICIGAIAFISVNQLGDVTSKRHTMLECGCYTLEEFMEYYPKYMPQAVIGSPVNKLYRKDIILKDDILFNVNIKNNEDTHFNYEYLAKCKTVYVSDNPFYNYIKREGVMSASHKYIENIVDVYISTYNKAKDFLTKTNSYDKHIVFQNNYFIGLIIGAINGIVQTNKLSKKEKLSKIKDICLNNDVCLAIKGLKCDNLKKKIVAGLIKRKQIRLLYLLFKLKT